MELLYKCLCLSVLCMTVCQSFCNELLGYGGKQAEIIFLTFWLFYSFYKFVLCFCQSAQDVDGPISDVSSERICQGTPGNYQDLILFFLVYAGMFSIRFSHMYKCHQLEANTRAILSLYLLCFFWFRYNIYDLYCNCTHHNEYD